MAIASKNKQNNGIINNLQAVLEKEGIKQSELFGESRVSGSTINKVANHKLAITKTTQNKLLIAINKMTGKLYELEDIFPDKKAK